jgi:prevent-host-death family protein
VITVNSEEAKTRLSELLMKVEQELEHVVICRNGRPVAELLPWKKSANPLRQCPKLKKIIFHESPVSALHKEDWQR